MRKIITILHLRLIRNSRGNVAIATAIMLPVLLGLCGITMDLIQMMNMKSRMQAAIDSAALAAASARSQKDITDDEARMIAARYLKGNSTDDMDFSKRAKVDLSSKTLGNDKIFTVQISTSYEYKVMELTALLTGRSYNISVNSKAEGINKKTVVDGTQVSASIMLVLDRSGSMVEPSDQAAGIYRERTPYVSNGKIVYAEPGDTRYLTKLETMKIAVKRMVAILNRADPEQKYVRMGANSFSSFADPPSPLSWNKAPLISYVDKLEPSGATNPAYAMKYAFDALSGTSEDNLQKLKTGKIPKKTIIYMTDGENTKEADSAIVQYFCSRMPEQRIESYVIGYRVSAKVKDRLTRCATDSSHAFFSNDAPNLYAAFEKIGGDQIKVLQTYLTN